MNWGDSALGASALLSKRVLRSLSGADYHLLVYAAGSKLVVMDARTAQR